MQSSSSEPPAAAAPPIRSTEEPAGAAEDGEEGLPVLLKEAQASVCEWGGFGSGDEGVGGLLHRSISTQQSVRPLHGNPTQPPKPIAPPTAHNSINQSIQD